MTDREQGGGGARHDDLGGEGHAGGAGPGEAGPEGERRSGGEQRRTARESVEDSVRQGLGVLTAFREALEETINEARARGDLSPERARAFMRDAMDRAQEAADEARERFDFAPRREVDALHAALRTLETRVARLEDRLAARETEEEGTRPPGGE